MGQQGYPGAMQQPPQFAYGQGQGWQQPGGLSNPE